MATREKLGGLAFGVLLASLALLGDRPSDAALRAIAGGGATPVGNTGAIQVNSAGALGGVNSVASGQCLLSNGVGAPPVYGSCTGTSGLAPSGTPTAFQTGVFASGTMVAG